MGLALCSACADAAPPTVSLVDGPCADVYGADVCTWAEVENEEVVRIGATIPLSSIENAPPEAEMAWPPVALANIPLPEIAIEGTGAQSLKIYWEAHGHPPGPYLVPHFDFHFYTISTEQIDAIDCSDVTKPSALPAGYDLPDVDIPEIGHLVGLCVPKMGMHAMLKSELESDEPFSGALVVGSYAGDPIFYEPMITQDLMMQQESFSLDFPAIPGDVPGVTLPTQFEAVYDEEAAAYRFVFWGFPQQDTP